MSERPPKKRKLQGGKADPNLVKIGDKFVSLEGYLNPKPKPAKSAPPKAENGIDKPLINGYQKDGSGNTLPSRDSQQQEDKDSNPRKSLKQDAARPGSTHHRKENQALLKTRQQLPIWSYRETIQRAVRESDILILVGETGSGKSTQVPQFLYRESWCRPQTIRRPTSTGEVREVSVGGIIAVTQPRRVAATTLANRVSQEAGTPLGKVSEGLVGYSVRFEHNVPRGAKIKFMTEGMLLQELLNDPNLLRYSAIVVDEIHERSVDVDLIVGFLKQIRASNFEGRGGIPLKIIVMSATVDVEKIGGFFAPEIETNTDGETPKPTDTAVQSLRTFETLHIRGRQYPVQIQHSPKPVPDLQDGMLRAVFKLHTEEPLPGDILVFLTGQEEIEAAQRLLEEYAATLASNVPKIKVLPLFGQLSIEAQHAAFLPVRDKFTRKVVLATNIAETSITVPGVRFVVDCGKAKVKQFRPRLGMESLLAKPISKSSAIQRAGRAGREGPGKCVRLYTKEGLESLQDKDLPEILRNDVLGAVLTMKACGIIDVLAFPLLDPPDVETVEKALVQLHLLGAVETHGAITEKGKRMARFPISAPFGAVLLAASEPEFDCVLEAIDVISCITSGDDIFQQIQSEEVKEEVELTRKELYRREGDILTYLTTIQQYTAENTDRMEWCKKRRINVRNMRLALKIRKQLRSLCLKEKLLTEPPPSDPQPFVPLSPERAEDLLKCFLRGFVTKTAMLHPDGSYVTVQAKHVVAIHPSSVIHGAKREAIMFLEHVFTQKNYAKKVSSIQAHWIAEELERS